MTRRPKVPTCWKMPASVRVVVPTRWRFAMSKFVYVRESKSAYIFNSRAGFAKFCTVQYVLNNLLHALHSPSLVIGMKCWIGDDKLFSSCHCLTSRPETKSYNSFQQEQRWRHRQGLVSTWKSNHEKSWTNMT